jgi:hypothetical protein
MRRKKQGKNRGAVGAPQGPSRPSSARSGVAPIEASGRPTEWVGGRTTAAVYVTEGEPFRPELVVWIELPSAAVLQLDVCDRGERGSVVELFRAATQRPLVGPPRRPRRIRVADAALAAELRPHVGDVEIVVAPTPELDAFTRELSESVAGEASASYTDGGRIPQQRVREFFDAALALYRAAPWNVAQDGQVLRVDIPVLDVEGACLSIIGNLGQSEGFLLFPSLEAFEEFVEAANQVGPILDEVGPPEVDLRTSWLAMNFEPATEIAEETRREVARHGWPVASPEAYPTVYQYQRDGVAAPTSERQVRIATAVAKALTTFFQDHHEIFAFERFEPVRERFTDHETGVTTLLTAPYEADEPFQEATRPRRRTKKIGRNDPCPCGSGRKYKRCHLSTDEAAHVEDRASTTLHERDNTLTAKMMSFAQERFDESWLRSVDNFDEPDECISLAAPWSLYHFEVDGRPVAEWFVESRGGSLPAEERAWLASQRRAWLSIWEVTGVEPGHAIELHDLLTGEDRHIVERSASETLRHRDAVLGRVVDHGGTSLLCGAYPQPLPPTAAAEVVDMIRRRLRRKRGVPPDRLRDVKISRFMIDRWQDAVVDLEIAAESPPQLRNTDGDEVLVTVDHFAFAPAKGSAVEAGLASIEGVHPPDQDETCYVFVRPGASPQGNTVIGVADVAPGRLRVETNSVRRADDLRRRIEASCPGLLQHRLREHTDPTSPAARVAMDAKRRPAAHAGENVETEPTAELSRAREFKRQHYATWADEPLEALGAKTPRQAARTRAGRRDLDLLLKYMENMESRLPREERFDFATIRGELGI